MHDNIAHKEVFLQLERIEMQAIPDTSWTLVEWYFSNKFHAAHRRLLVSDLVRLFDLEKPLFESKSFILDAIDGFDDVKSEQGN